MGNVLTMTDEEITNRLNDLGGKNITEEQIEATKTLLKDEGVRNLLCKISTESEILQKEMATKAEEIFNMPPKEYEGCCGFTVEDPKGQRILDKYLPRDLNSHATDMLNIFSKTTFKELRESTDRYPETAFWSDPLNYIFLAHDSDFLAFFNKFPIDIDLMVEKCSFNRQIFREVLQYIVNINNSISPN